MTKTTWRQKKLRVYANDGDITVHADIHVYSRNGALTSPEFKKLVGRVIRGVPKMLEGLPFTDFGIDNISIAKVKAQ